MRSKLLFIVLMLASNSTGLCCQDAECKGLNTTDRGILRKFLREHQQRRESSCLVSTIDRLGNLKDTEAVHLLATYLDYKDPSTGPLPGGGGTDWPRYPAVSALFKIGKPATNELLLAIQAGSSALLRENAQHTFEFIYRDDPWSGIRTLRTALPLATSDEARRRLTDVSRVLMDECKGRGEKEAEACRNAAG